MTLRQWFQVIKKRKLIIIVITGIVILATVLFTLLSKPTYEAGISFAIKKDNVSDLSQADFYQYDDYYSIQASGMFADSIIGWLATPGLASEIYSQANIPLPQISISKLAKSFRAKRKTGTNIIDLVIKSDNRSKAELLANTISDMAQKKALEIQPTKSATNFKVLAHSPVVVEIKPKILQNTIFGLLTGLILAIIIAFTVEYFQRKE